MSGNTAFLSKNTLVSQVRNGSPAAWIFVLILFFRPVPGGSYHIEIRVRNQGFQTAAGAGRSAQKGLDKLTILQPVWITVFLYREPENAYLHLHKVMLISIW